MRKRDIIKERYRKLASEDGKSPTIREVRRLDKSGAGFRSLGDWTEGGQKYHGFWADTDNAGFAYNIGLEGLVEIRIYGNSDEGRDSVLDWLNYSLKTNMNYVSQEVREPAGVIR